MDAKSISLWGDFNTEKGSNLMIAFEMCEGRADCKTEAEIREWLKMKFIVLLYNQVSFNPEGYDEESVNRDSRFAYITISSKIRERQLIQIQMSEI